MSKSKSGLQAALASAVKGTLIVGDGTAPLANNSWFMISAVKAVGSELPIEKVSAVFKTPDAANAITPAVGDNVWPITVTVQCKVTAELTNEKGSIDVSDDCSDGYMSHITDGFTGVSGSYEQFLKFDSTTQGLPTAQKDVLQRFYDIVEDSGAGVYTLKSKNDDDLYLFVFLNRAAAIGEKQTCFIIPAILTGANTTEDNKAGMNLSVTWTKAEGWAGLYERVLNVAADL